MGLTRDSCSLIWCLDSRVFSLFCRTVKRKNGEEKILLVVYQQTFSELIDAASKGDERFVNQYHADLVKVIDSVEGEDSWYTACAEASPADNQLVFCFGKAVGSELGTSDLFQSRTLSSYRIALYRS